MLSQPLNSILALCLLTLSYCSAMQRNPSIGGSSSPRRGTGIIAAANCSGRKYIGYKLQQAAQDAKSFLDDLEESNVQLTQVEYTTTTQERTTMPFSPPYYYHLIALAPDFVVVTRDGKLAKVVYEATSPIRFIDCEIRYA